MKKVLISLFALMFAVALVSGVSFAAEAAKPEAAKAAPEKKEKAKKETAKTEKAKGTVKSIDQAKGELVVTAEGGADMTFKIKKTQAKGVKAGDMVTVSYEKKGEEMTAKRVTKAKAKMEKKEGTKKEEKK